MTNFQIYKYLENNKWKITAQDMIMNILNTSPQIINEEYDFDTHTMIIKTSEIDFKFTILLGECFNNKDK